MMLLGSIARRTLLELLSRQIHDDIRKKEAEKRIRHAIETIDEHFREAQSQFTIFNSISEQEFNINKNYEPQTRRRSKSNNDNSSNDEEIDVDIKRKTSLPKTQRFNINEQQQDLLNNKKTTKEIKRTMSESGLLRQKQLFKKKFLFDNFEYYIFDILYFIV